MATLDSQIIEVVENFPNSTLHDIALLLPDASPTSVNTRTGALVRAGRLLHGPKAERTNSRGSRCKANTFKLNPDPNPKPPHRELKLRAPTMAGLEAQLAEIRAELLALREWKVKAEERFPELKVSPEVIEARQLVAETLKGEGDHGHAAEVLAGKHDNTPLVKVALKALGGC